jgi:hypothetical protein
MTPRHYTEAARFPLTTRAGLTAQVQALTDACGLAELHVFWTRWNKLTRLQPGRLAEFEEKARR